MSEHMRTLFYLGGFGSAHEPFEKLFDGVLRYGGNENSISKHDVLIFDGGTDVDSSLYGEAKHPFADFPNRARDEYERQAFRRAQSVGAACVGICRGAQFLCVLSGGKLIQDVAGHRARNHAILTDDRRVLMANADHHQMMYPYPVHHKLLAWTEGIGTSNCEYGKEWEDGREPEIIYIPDTRSLCIQPHPEWMAHDTPFVKYCQELVHTFIFEG